MLLLFAVNGYLIIIWNFVLPLTKASINFIFSGKDNYDITFVGVIHAIGEVPPIVVQR